MNREAMTGSTDYIKFDRVRNQTTPYVNERIDLLTSTQIERATQQ